MNELLQKHGCTNVFSIPDGLRELMSDISREVLREQPVQICDFIANYLSALLITREHGVLAVKILDDLCDCRPSVSEHLIQTGMRGSDVGPLSQIINEEIKSVQMVEGKEKVKEAEILRRILKRNPMDEETAAKVCQIARNAYRDYWYRKRMLEQNLKVQPDEPWEIAAQHTLEIYKRTKPSFTELTRATQKIQAAYRGYHVRRQMLGHLKPKKKQAPKVDLLGPPVDIAESREIDLGPVVDIKDKVYFDDMSHRFMEDDHTALGLGYDTMKTITQVEPPGAEQEYEIPVQRDRTMSRIVETRSEPYNMRLQAASKKSGMMMQPEPYPGQPEQEQAYRKSDIDELPAPLAEAEPHITFGPPEEIALDQFPPDQYPPEQYPPDQFPPDQFPPEFVPEDIQPAAAEFVSDAPTPAFDGEVSSVVTDSIPTSAPTTAPTSDIEDVLTSEGEGGGE